MFRQFETAQHAKLYAQFRPEPPASLIRRVVQFVAAPLERAVDVGCGSGQNTRHLAPYFRSVLATDISPAQIAEAAAGNTQDTVQYRVSAAEQIPAPDRSVQLVTAATCYHYFDKPRFLAEVDRVLAPGGVVAIYYNSFPHTRLEDGRTWTELDNVVHRVREAHIDQHWVISLQAISDGYKEAVRLIRYPDVVWDDASHHQERPLSVDALLGELSSWSGFQSMVKSRGAERGEAVLRQAREELLAVVAAGEKSGVNSTTATTRHQYNLVMARKPVSSGTSGQ